MQKKRTAPMVFQFCRGRASASGATATIGASSPVATGMGASSVRFRVGSIASILLKDAPHAMSSISSVERHGIISQSELP